jgi:hypothetical protein
VALHTAEQRQTQRKNVLENIVWEKQAFMHACAISYTPGWNSRERGRGKGIEREGEGTRERERERRSGREGERERGRDGKRERGLSDLSWFLNLDDLGLNSDSIATWLLDVRLDYHSSWGHYLLQGQCLEQCPSTVHAQWRSAVAISWWSFRVHARKHGQPRPVSSSTLRTKP